MDVTEDVVCQKRKPIALVLALLRPAPNRATRYAWIKWLTKIG